MGAFRKIGKFFGEIVIGELGQFHPNCRHCGKRMKEFSTFYGPGWHQCMNKSCEFYGLMKYGSANN
jgi:hypothetical protein